mgnify:CR=1 FL=1
MADFCSFCYYGDINYNTLIKENIDEINSYIDKHGHAYIKGGICEGCCSTSIKINKDKTIQIDSKNYIGTLDKDNEIVVDESSDTFIKTYREKKERSNLELKTILREFESVKHIAYALYMIGDKPGIISHHDCISFEEFDVKNYKSISDRAWMLYSKLNQNKDDE